MMSESTAIAAVPVPTGTGIPHLCVLEGKLLYRHDYDVLYCSKCGQVAFSSRWFGHFSTYHPNLWKHAGRKLGETEFDEAVSEFLATMKQQRIESGRVPDLTSKLHERIVPIPVLPGFMSNICTTANCFFCAKKESTVKTHVRKHHKDKYKAGDYQMVPCKMQRLSAGRLIGLVPQAAQLGPAGGGQVVADQEGSTLSPTIMQCFPSSAELISTLGVPTGSTDSTSLFEKITEMRDVLLDEGDHGRMVCSRILSRQDPYVGKILHKRIVDAVRCWMRKVHDETATITHHL
jgi:hypothetical protein